MLVVAQEVREVENAAAVEDVLALHRDEFVLLEFTLRGLWAVVVVVGWLLWLWDGCCSCGVVVVVVK